MALTNDLRHRLTVFNKHQIENDIGETCWQYTEDGKIWVSCLHLGQNNGKFFNSVSPRILRRVLFPHTGQRIHSILCKWYSPFSISGYMKLNMQSSETVRRSNGVT